MMKIAVFSDIHSNFTAFKACLDRAVKAKADKLVFLGDYISDCAFPQDTMALIHRLRKEYDCRFVLGNRDGYMLEQGHEAWYPCSGCGSLYYTYQNLTSGDLEFFASLKHYHRVKFEAVPEFSICHGSPRGNNDLITEENAPVWLNSLDTGLLLCGHVHSRKVFSHGEKSIVRAGSLGIQTDGASKAKMGFITSDGGRWQPEFLDVEYDIQEELNRLRKSGLYELAPVWTRATEWMLERGEDLTIPLLERVRELSEGGGWPYPEEAWRQAEKELF